MNPAEMLESVYLGDRACKQVAVECWRRRIRIQFDLISRIRSQDGQWHHYSDEDIEDGWIVFEGVRHFSMTPPGPLPDDYAISHRATPVPARETESARGYECVFEIGSADVGYGWATVVLKVIAEAAALEDPRRPGELIRT